MVNKREKELRNSNIINNKMRKCRIKFPNHIILDGISVFVHIILHPKSFLRLLNSNKDKEEVRKEVILFKLFRIFCLSFFVTVVSTILFVLLADCCSPFWEPRWLDWMHDICSADSAFWAKAEMYFLFGGFFVLVAIGYVFGITIL